MEFFKILKSVLSAMIGVQKKKNLQEDFSKSSATPFIIAGIIMTLIFIISIWAVVQFILNTSDLWSYHENKSLSYLAKIKKTYFIYLFDIYQKLADKLIYINFI